VEDSTNVTPYEAEREAERRWPGWAARADCKGDVFAVKMTPFSQRGMHQRLIGEPVGRSRVGFIDALRALGPPPAR
jgi:hypothetical protein